MEMVLLTESDQNIFDGTFEAELLHDGKFRFDDRRVALAGDLEINVLFVAQLSDVGACFHVDQGEADSA